MRSKMSGNYEVGLVEFPPPFPMVAAVSCARLRMDPPPPAVDRSSFPISFFLSRRVSTRCRVMCPAAGGPGPPAGVVGRPRGAQGRMVFFFG